METENKITPEQLAEWKELCEKATPGPWKMWGMAACAPHLSDCQYGGKASDDRDIVARTYYQDEQGHPRTFDCNFITASRTALPRLLDEVARLNKCLDQAIEIGAYGVGHGRIYDGEFDHDGSKYPNLYEELKRRGL